MFKCSQSIQRSIVLVSLHQHRCRVSLAAVRFAEHVFVHVQVFTAVLKDQDYQMLVEIYQLLFGSVFNVDSLEQYYSIIEANFL